MSGRDTELLFVAFESRGPSLGRPQDIDLMVGSILQYLLHLVLCCLISFSRHILCYVPALSTQCCGLGLFLCNLFSLHFTRRYLNVFYTYFLSVLGAVHFSQCRQGKGIPRQLVHLSCSLTNQKQIRQTAKLLRCSRLAMIWRYWGLCHRTMAAAMVLSPYKVS